MKHGINARPLSKKARRKLQNLDKKKRKISTGTNKAFSIGSKSKTFKI